MQGTVVADSQLEADLRRARNERVDRLLRAVENARDVPFTSATGMLSWFFSVADHMASVPAIDPAAEVIQGLRVDKDDRHWRIQSVRQALAALVEAQGSSYGALCLWLHLRPRVPTKTKQVDGRQVTYWSEPVALSELSKAPELCGYVTSRRDAQRTYWASLRWLEDYAWSRKWICRRMEKKAKVEQVYRREPEPAEQ